MENSSFFKLKRDIDVAINKKSSPQVKKIPIKKIPVFQKINDDIPYLTEEKIEDAYLNDKVSLKTRRLLEWLCIKENFEIAENIYNNNKSKFEEISFLIENERTDFSTFIRRLIKKHELAISNRE